MIIGITIPDSGKVSLFGKPFDRQSLERVGYLCPKSAVSTRK